jgi:hypothetical protein
LRWISWSVAIVADGYVGLGATQMRDLTRFFHPDERGEGGAVCVSEKESGRKGRREGRREWMEGISVQ